MRLLPRAGRGMVRRLVTRALGWDSEAGWSMVRGSQPSEFQHTGREVRRLGWERHPVVQACLREVVQIVAAVPLEVYRQQGTETVLLPRHPAQALLDRPRAAMSGSVLRSRTALPLAAYGNAFWVLERRGVRGMPIAIRVLHPERLQTVYVDPETDEIRRYQWTDLQGRTHVSEAEDVVHIPDLTLAEDWLFGYPRIAAALLDVHADHEATQYVRQVVGNHGQPGMVVKTKGYRDKATLDTAEAAFNEKMVARGGRGGALFVNAEDMELTPIGFNLSELEFPDLRGIAREDICAAAGVDPRMIGLHSASNDGGLSGVQYREARFRLIQQTVLPLMKLIESQLDVWFAPEFGDVRVRFSPDVLSEMTEDEAATSARAIAEMTAGARTREEARELIGLPAEMDPTHTLVGSISRLEYPVALGAAASEQRLLPPAPGSDPAGDDDPPPNESPAQRALPPGSPLTRCIRRGMVLTPEQRVGLWQQFDTRAEASEPAYRRTALLLFHAERDDIDRLFAEAIPGEAARADRADPPGDVDPILEAVLRAILEGYAPGGTYTAAWIARYRGLVSETFTSAGEGIAASVGVDFTLDNPRVQAAIRRRATGLAELVTAETAEQITAAVTTGRASGMSIREVATLVRETVFGEDMTTTRATRIARTETVGALNEGEYTMALESGVMQSKEWLTQGDGRVRDSHAALNGVRIPIGQAFGNGLQHPGARPAPPEAVINCRCTLLFYDEEAPT